MERKTEIWMNFLFIKIYSTYTNSLFVQSHLYPFKVELFWIKHRIWMEWIGLEWGWRWKCCITNAKNRNNLNKSIEIFFSNIFRLCKLTNSVCTLKKIDFLLQPQYILNSGINFPFISFFPHWFFHRKKS